MSLGTLRCPYVNDRKNQNRGYDWGEGRTGKILNVSLRVIWFEGLNGVVIGSNISSRELDGPTLEVARAMENSCSPDVIRNALARALPSSTKEFPIMESYARIYL
jgi:hypothetical protein